MSSMAQMKPETKAAEMHLQTYGALYLGGVDPVDIESMYEHEQFSKIEEALAGVMGEGQADVAKQKAANAVEMAFAATAVVTTIVTTVIGAVSAAASATGVGVIVGAVLQVVGAIVAAVLGDQSLKACDDEENLPGSKYNTKASQKREKRHRRAIVGQNVPPGAYMNDDATCNLTGYGGSNDSLQARHGYVATYMNDGMWWWGKKDPKKHQDVLNGTVIGVKALVNTGITAGCHRRMYDNPETPILKGMSPGLGAPLVKIGAYSTDGVTRAKAPSKAADSLLSAEFKARQEAVTQVQSWMRWALPYGVLSCMDKLLKDMRGTGVDYKVCSNYEGCKESSIAHFMQGKSTSATGLKNYHNFGDVPDVYKLKAASRIYASIRSMFQACVAQSELIGVNKAWSIIRENGGNVSRGLLKRAIRAQHENKEVWPEHDFAQKMGWSALRGTLADFSIYVKTQIAGDEAFQEAYEEARLEQQASWKGPLERQRARAMKAATEAARRAKRTTSYSYAPVVRARIEELRTNQWELGAGGLGKFGRLVPPWLIYTGAGALALGGLYLLWKSGEED